MSSSRRTWSAPATLTSTASVGFAAPDSRLAQVARGTPAIRAICCCVTPRASRRVWMLRPRWRAVSPSAPLAGASNAVASCQYISTDVDILSGVESPLSRRRPMNDLDGINALVTGGSQGLGRALGLALGRAGARVVLVARHAEPLAAVVAEIRAAGGEAHAIAADVADQEAAFKIAGQAAALVGPIDLLVNNASTLGPVPLRLLLDTDCEDLERALAVNLVGPFRLTKALAGSMVLRGSGVVVNISSDAAVEAYERWG